MRKTLFCILMFLVSFGSFARAAVNADRTLVVRWGSNPITLDWGGAAKLDESIYIMNLMEGLFRFNGNAIEPAIAEKVEVSKDLQEYTFHLDPKRKWSDGRPVYATDFVYAWLRILSPQSTSIYYPYLFGIKNSKAFHDKKVKEEDVGLKVISDFKFKVTLSQPQKNWHWATAFWPMFPMRKDQIEKQGVKFTRPGLLITNGPYVYDSYEQGRKVILKRNKYYPGNLLPKIEIKIIPDDHEACEAYKKSEFEIMFYGSACVPKDAKPISMLEFYYFGANTKRFPSNQVNFRRAVFDAIDLKGAVPQELKVDLTDSLFPAALMKPEKKPSIYDESQVVSELKKSGIKLTQKTIVSILFYNEASYVTAGKKIKEQLEKKLGINVDARFISAQDYYSYLDLHDYHFFMISWTPKVWGPEDFLRPFLNENNRMSYDNPMLRIMTEQAMAEGNSEDAHHLFRLAEKKLLEDDAVVRPLFFKSGLYTVRQRVKGVYFDYMGIPYFRKTSLLD
jgi:oligopeptide transport system substrate-binding protein